MKLIIDLNGVHRDEIKDLEDYLETNCWKWEKK